MTKFSSAIHYLRLYGEVHMQNEHRAEANGDKAGAKENALAQQEIVAAIQLLAAHDEPRTA